MITKFSAELVKKKKSIIKKPIKEIKMYIKWLWLLNISSGFWFLCFG